MRHRLVLFGVLSLLVGAALVHEARPTEAATPVQAFTVTSAICYGGSAPGGGVFSCGAGSSETAVGTGATVTTWELTGVAAGSRLQACGPTGARSASATECLAPILSTTYTPSDWTLPASPSGDFTMALDLLCSGGADDILAGSGSIPGGGAWPGSNWVNYALSSTAVPGWLPAHVGSPTSFPAYSNAAGTMTHVWIAGVALFPFPTPSPVNVATMTSSHVAGLRVSHQVLLGAPAPPTNGYICVDAPARSIASIAGVTAPSTPGLYPRWSTLSSVPDIRGGQVSRVLDIHCVNVGGFGGADADGDCLDDTDPADIDCGTLGRTPSDADCDGDLMVDGIEKAMGTNGGSVASCPAPNGANTNGADCDGDTVMDFNEMFQSTDPNDSDTDGDSSLDEQDDGSDEVPGTLTNVEDTSLDDNCPAETNDQTNSDSGILVNGTLLGDTTNGNQDQLGDACDNDDDNDNLLDSVESTLRIIAWAGAGTTVCRASGGSPPAITMGVTDPDSDDDGLLDGKECEFGSRPDIANPAIASCTTGPVDPDGCAQLRPPAAGEDPDIDKLYHSGSGPGHASVEAVHRTRQIRTGVGTSTNDPDGDSTAGDADSDSDNDGVSDGAETWGYGTEPANPDTDGDGCSDGREAASVNGDRAVSGLDLQQVAVRFGGYVTAGVVDPLKLTYDFNRDGTINAVDLGFVAARFGNCSAQTALPISGGNQ